ncbi:MAG: hypothetical protein ABL885_01315 [Methylophilaceae bacterium]
MAIEQDWNMTQLQDYLLYGYWSPVEAWLRLSGLDAWSFPDFDGWNLSSLHYMWLEDGDYRPLDPLMKFEFAANPELGLDRYEGVVSLMRCGVSRLQEFWRCDMLDGEAHPPAFFIEWALSKRFRPAWLDWAIEHNLYTPRQEIITENKTQADNAATYSTSWLEIQQAAISEFFNPRRNPDAKRDEVIAWINLRAAEAGLAVSGNIAASIFTIIKPENHDPKKKRVEPQQSQ